MENNIPNIVKDEFNYLEERGYYAFPLINDMPLVETIIYLPDENKFYKWLEYFDVAHDFMSMNDNYELTISGVYGLIESSKLISNKMEKMWS